MTSSYEHKRAPYKFPAEPTGRTDTTVTQVRVVPGDIGSLEGAAALRVRDSFPEATVLAVWRDPGPRLPGGQGVIYHVEWEELGADAGQCAVCDADIDPSSIPPGQPNLCERCEQLTRPEATA